MKKRFKVLMDDSGKGVSYSIWDFGENGFSIAYRYAEFYGKQYRRYAYAVCKTLNALPEKDKP